jgi:hypothetical protein
MSILALRAYGQLIRFETYLLRSNFQGLHRKVRRYPVASTRRGTHDIDKLCRAIDLACIWYWKQVLCLQRSAATTCLLRQFGVPAHMVIGAQQIPFRTHAWVEVDAQVVNDRAYVREIYSVLDCC